MTSSEQIAYGVIVAVFFGCLATAVYIFIVRERRRKRRNDHDELARIPSAPSETSLSPSSCPSQSHGMIILGADQPPDYESVVRNGRESRVYLPPPTMDQMGTYTTEYVTGIEPSLRDPVLPSVSGDHGIIFLSGPLHEVR